MAGQSDRQIELEGENARVLLDVFAERDRLRAALHEEQKFLWADFANAVRFAQVGKLDPEGDRNANWSAEMTDLADRILNIAQLVGPTRWEDVETGPLAGGWYKAVYGQAGIDYPEPDWDRVAEVQRAERGE